MSSSALVRAGRSCSPSASGPTSTFTTRSPSWRRSTARAPRPRRRIRVRPTRASTAQSCGGLITGTTCPGPSRLDGLLALLAGGRVVVRLFPALALGVGRSARVGRAALVAVHLPLRRVASALVDQLFAALVLSLR